jgi:hypothetical protein
MNKPNKASKDKPAAKLKDLKTKKNPTGGVFNSSIATPLTGGSIAMKATTPPVSGAGKC